MKFFYILGLCILPIQAVFCQKIRKVSIGIYGGSTISGGVSIWNHTKKINMYPFGGIYAEIPIDNVASIVNAISYHHFGYQIDARSYWYEGTMHQQLSYVSNITYLRLRVDEWRMGFNFGIQSLFLVKSSLTKDEKPAVSNRKDFVKFKPCMSVGVDWSPVRYFSLFTQFHFSLTDLNKSTLKYNHEDDTQVDYSNVELGLRIPVVKLPVGHMKD